MFQDDAQFQQQHAQKMAQLIEHFNQLSDDVFMAEFKAFVSQNIRDNKFRTVFDLQESMKPRLDALRSSKVL